ncbi:hypothetical protein GCM10022396_12570 [Flavivirga amylovorans]
MQAQNITEQLEGTWTFNYNSSLAKMKTKAKEHYINMETTRKLSFEKSYKNRTLSFNNDGTFLQVSPNGRQVMGNWTVTSDTIILTNSLGKTMKFKIKSLSTTAMTLKLVITGNSRAILTELDYIKN